jgi:hypothetical protein
MHYFALIIPFVIAIFYKIKFHRDITFLEFAITLAIIVALTFASVAIFSTVNTNDKKIISGYTVGKRYIPEHEETRVRMTTDSDGDTSLETYTVTVPDDYVIFVAQQKVMNVTKQKSYYDGELIGSNNGIVLDCDSSKYNATSIGEIAAWIETYKNPIKRNRNTLFKKIKQSQFPIPHTPKIYNLFDINRVTVIGNVKLDKDYHAKVNLINSMLNRYNINIGFIITTLPETYYDYLKNQWRGGQANDCIVLLFVDEKNILHNADVVCWGNEYLRSKIKYDIMDKHHDLKNFDSIISIVYNDIKERGFIEENFSKFEYLRVELPSIFLIILFIASIIISIIILELFRTNELIESSY